MSALTQERLKELLFYDPDTGVWTWKNGGRGRRKNHIAGWRCGEGYILIYVDGEQFYAHRLAFLYMTGSWPAEDTDHKDMDRSNNRWNNLREATRGENHRNKVARKDSSSGLKGVIRDKERGAWQARITVGGKTVNLGRFDCPAAAHFAYIIAADKMHGAFARTT